jgi:16S rRNA (guanine(527)-N(7))-methyltransferase RsmG
MNQMMSVLGRAGLYEQLTDDFTEEQFRRLNEFLELRAQWSHTHNLSGPRALTLLSTDIADAVAVWLCTNMSRPLVDIGSGSGVPGLMVACLAPELQVHLVEPLAKRCAFMKTVAHKLGLKSVKVHRGRWPNIGTELDGVISISRAVVSPEEWPLLADQPQVFGVMQMLAHHRPQWPLEHYDLVQSVNYIDPEGGSRVVHRWEKSI